MEKGHKSTSYPWGHERRYNDFSSYIKSIFGGRVQKLSINAGFTCPNRDGSKDTRGCSYCNNSTFRPAYCEPEKSVTQQIDDGIEFFAWKYPDMRFLGYFQSYSNTYGDLKLLDDIYSEALAHDKIAGLVLGTRPDCVDGDILDLIAEKSKTNFVAVEYGIESTIDRTLERINRHHSYQDAIEAFQQTKARNIHTGAHLILGLPGESREEMLDHASRVSQLPLDTLKLHQLQIVSHTTFAKEFKQHPDEFQLFSKEAYVEFAVDFLELLNPDIVMERFVNQSPADMLIAPKWGSKNFEIVAKIERRMKERNTYQGRLHQVH